MNGFFLVAMWASRNSGGLRKFGESWRTTRDPPLAGEALDAFRQDVVSGIGEVDGPDGLRQRLVQQLGAAGG